jgi:hypothetical protein
MTGTAIMPEFLAEEILPPLDFARYAPAPPVVIDHEPAAGAAPSAYAIAFACWHVGWMILWGHLRYRMMAGLLLLRWRLFRLTRSLTAAYAVAAMGWGAAGALLTMMIWR